MYEINTKLVVENGPLSFMGNLNEVDTFKSPIEIISSVSSVGLQLIDIVLWLTKKHYENPIKKHPHISNLIPKILKSSFFIEFSRRQLFYTVLESLKILESIPITEEDEKRALKIMKDIEEKRKKRMIE